MSENFHVRLDVTEKDNAIKDTINNKDSLTVDVENIFDDCEAEEKLQWDTTAKNTLEKFQNFVIAFFTRHSKFIIRSIVFAALTAYFVYFGFALHYNFQASIALLVITCLVVGWIGYLQFQKHLGKPLLRALSPVSKFLKRAWPYFQWILKPGIVIVIIVYLSSIISPTDNRQILSILGLVFFMSIPLVTCKHPSKIKWRPVVWGMGIQFFLGIAVLRWRPGYQAVSFLAQEINKFLFYCLRGAAAVFGDPFFLFHPFLMLILPLFIYVGAVTGFCHHLGIIQWVVSKIGFWMRLTMGTTGIESISMALNIFFSVPESILILRPYIPNLTKSEFHTLLVGSHATIAGWAYAIFVLFGVDGRHLLTAAVMSAPAAVAIAKLNYPETEESLFKDEDSCMMDRGNSANVMEAMTTGAHEASKTITSLGIQIIAFLSCFEFLDVSLEYLGALVGLEISMSIIFSYIFMPIGPLLGISWEDSRTVSYILGLKLTTSEMLAYLELGKLRVNNIISKRTSALVTYAICGFSSFGTLAMLLGVWSTVDEKRVSQVSALIPRIFMNTNLACFVTACVAAILYDESISEADFDEPVVDLVTFYGLLPSYKQLLPLSLQVKCLFWKV